MHKFIPDSAGYRVIFFGEPGEKLLREVLVVGWLLVNEGEKSEKWTPAYLDTSFGGVDSIWTDNQDTWEEPWLLLGPNEELPDRETCQKEVSRRNSRLKLFSDAVLKIIEKYPSGVSVDKIHEESEFVNKRTWEGIVSLRGAGKIVSLDDGTYVLNKEIDD